MRSTPPILRVLLPLLALACLGLLLSCSKPIELKTEHTPPSILLPTAQAGIVDGRGRFREIFSAVNKERGKQLPDPRTSEGDSALWRLTGEPPATGRPVQLGKSTAGLRALMVPGLLAECVADKSKLFEDSVANLEAQGYKTGYIQTRGRQSSERNALLIRDAILAQPEGEKLLLVAHSKGGVDSLQALAQFPELADRVLAVISVSGAINGSPIADIFPEGLAEFIEEVKISDCPPGEGVEAMDSLRRTVRLQWLAAHPLPQKVRYYSLAAFAKPEDMSAVLKPFYDILGRNDPLNDGLVLCSDAIIPGSVLLGYPNADHMAVGMPFAEKNPFISATLLTRNRYPRATLLEAAVRFVEEDLRDRGVLP
jgi:pimeloyl-ACP methyl ester carboxylesterase